MSLMQAQSDGFSKIYQSSRTVQMKIYLIMNTLISVFSHYYHSIAPQHLRFIYLYAAFNFYFIIKKILTMSRATTNQTKPTTSSKVTSKSAPTNWKDRLEPQDWEQLKQTFEVFDEDGSGTIDAAEINKVLEELGVDKRNPLVLGIINKLKEANKAIKFQEFVEIAAGSVGEVRTKDGIRRVFALLDKNEDGHLDFEQFKTALKSIQEHMNDDDILEMMHSTFINRKTSSNESFTFDEFYSVVTFHNQSK